MAYDPANGSVVLFGGQSRFSTLNDTWIWNGSAWTEAHPRTSPPRLSNAQMTYDPVSHDVLLIGGPELEGSTGSPIACSAGSGTSSSGSVGSTTTFIPPPQPNSGRRAVAAERHGDSQEGHGGDVAELRNGRVAGSGHLVVERQRLVESPRDDAVHRVRGRRAGDGPGLRTRRPPPTRTVCRAGSRGGAAGDRLRGAKPGRPAPAGEVPVAGHPHSRVDLERSPVEGDGLRSQHPVIRAVQLIDRRRRRQRQAGDLHGNVAQPVPTPLPCTKLPGRRQRAATAWRPTTGSEAIWTGTSWRQVITYDGGPAMPGAAFVGDPATHSDVALSGNGQTWIWTGVWTRAHPGHDASDRERSCRCL